MRFALLGCDEKTAQIAEWIARTEKHTVNAVYQPGDYARTLADLYPAADMDDGWEASLLNKDIDAVIVGYVPSGTMEMEQRADQLRKLVQESVPTLLVHPACESIVAFELEMIRPDTNCPLVAYVPNKYHSAFVAFCDAVRESDDSIGTVEQIVVTRCSTNRDRQTVLRLLAEDSMLITEMIGDVKTVSAAGATGEDNTNLANLSVTFVGDAAAGARWSIEPAGHFDGVKLSAIANRGKTSLILPEDGTNASLIVDGKTELTDKWSTDFAIADAANRLEALINGDDATPTDLARSFHSLEIVDAVTQSCRRKRAIELLAEQPTEEDTFKAMMAAGGCGMLIWTLVLVVLGPLLFMTGSVVVRIAWYVLLIGPISVFLGLQLLRFVFDDKET
ncbi:hypothetical protein ACFL2H_13770 [Planctomycetota bacterium]